MEGATGYTCYRELYEQILVFTSQQDVDAQSLYILLERHKDTFLNLFARKAPDAATRQQVQSCRVTLTNGEEMALDPEPDVRLALLLSDELKLNEASCVELLLAAQEERATLSAESAAGLYFEERRSLLAALELVLQTHAVDVLLGTQAQSPPWLEVLRGFVGELVGTQRADGRGVLVSRLLELIKDSSLEGGAGSRLQQLVSEQGGVVPRVQVVQAERTLLARCLLYAVVARRRVPAAVVAELLDLLGGLTLKARNAGAAEADVRKQEVLVALAAALALAPQDASAAEERSALQQLGGAPELQQRFETGAPSVSGYQGLVRIAWGLLQAHPAARGAGGQAARDPSRYWEEASRGGALGFVRGVVQAPAFLSEGGVAQQLLASVLYLLATDVMRQDARAGRQYEKALVQAITAPPRRPDPAPIFAAAPSGPPAPPPDHIGTLLALLAALFEVKPDLLLIDSEAGSREAAEAVDGLVNRVASSHPDTRGIMNSSVEVRVAFLSLLTALTKGEALARQVWHQLAAWGANAAQYPMLSWRVLFDSLVQYCGKYHAALAAANSAGRLVVHSREEQLMNPADAQAVVAYLKLFRALVAEGEEGEVRVWLEALRAELVPVLGTAPLYELLFQLMCYPVPNTVKAAIDEVLAAMARFPEVASVYLSRLLQAVVVAPSFQSDSYTPKYDLVMQLNEIEARQEEYPETIAFLRLLNALLGSLAAAGGGALPEAGREVGHLTAFVRDHVLRHLWLRSYRDPQQKWEVAAEAFTHMHLAVTALIRAEGGLPPDYLSKPPPGIMALNDILGGATIMQAILHVLDPGVDALMDAARAGGAGPREAAVAAALKLLNAVLECDERYVQLTASLPPHERLAPLEAQFRHSPAGIQRLSTILQYSCYAPSAEVVTEALRLLLPVSGRLPHIVELLQQPSFDLTACYQLREGISAALLEGLRNLQPMGDAAAETGLGYDDESSQADERAPLVLQLLLQSATSGLTPNLAHLLLGYSPEPSPGAVESSVLLLKEFTCLRHILHFLKDGDLQMATLRPRLYTHCLRLLYEMARDPPSQGPLLELLQHPELLELPARVLALELPPPAQHQATVYRLHQYSWALRLQALLLYRLDAPAAIEQLLGSMYPAASAAALDPSMAAVAPLRSAVLDVLSKVASVKVVDNLEDIASYEEVRMQQEMAVGGVSVRQLLQSEEAGLELWVEADTGDRLISFPRLMQELKIRYETYVQGNPAGGEELPRRAVQKAFEYAQQRNGLQQLAAAQAAAAEGWMQAVSVTFAARFGMLERLAGPGRPALILYEIVLDTLEELSRLAVGRDLRLAPHLGAVVACLLDRLATLASDGMGLNGRGEEHLGGVRTPSRCRALLGAILGLVEAMEGCKGRAAGELRVLLYQALSQYLRLSRGARLAQSPPHVLRALLSDSGDVEAAARNLDATQSDIDRSTSELIGRAVQHTRLLEGIAELAADGGIRAGTQALALALLTDLVRCDDSLVVARRLMSHSGSAKPLPAMLLDGLPAAAQHALTASGSKAPRAVAVVASQLKLLQALALAGRSPRQQQESAQGVFALQAVARLSDTDALSFQPEPPRELTDRSTTRLRYRLHAILVPALQLVLGLLTALPDSSAVRSEAARFVASHHLALCRVLEDATHPGTATWEPAQEELQQAQLAMVLLAQLARHLPSEVRMQPGAPDSLRAAVLTVAREFLALQSSARSPLAAALLEDKSWTGDLDDQWQRMTALRGAVSKWLREVVAGGQDPHGLLQMVGGEGNIRFEAVRGAQRPTLVLISETVREVGAEIQDAACALQKALQHLQLPASSLTEDVVLQLLQDYAPSSVAARLSPGLALSSKRRIARGQLAVAAAHLDALLGRLVALAENSLATILIHFIRCLPRPYPTWDGANGSGTNTAAALNNLLASAGGAVGDLPSPTPEDAEKLGNRQQRQLFFIRLRTACAELEGVVEGATGVGGHDLRHLTTLLRSVQAYMAQQ